MKFLEAWPELAWVLLAIMGGIARYLDSYLKSGQTPKFGMMLAHACISGFAGYMVAQVAIKFQPDWALIAAGIGGYLGTQGMDMIADILRERLGAQSANDLKDKKDKTKEDDNGVDP